ncbi:MAG: acetylglutamate kinase [Bacteroidetes bacterium]|nr:acetylglutamate kinase [Rhodothermia bacterium]MCX7907548.1 acetylglutamate kinase [Bacteroidota bacterium]MDW8138542.1 acetylglutamate kinase [Bacteroidota bacterium]MDW8284521.1 acetylglutamate kinase [Bacteroidota bacterium]
MEPVVIKVGGEVLEAEERLQALWKGVGFWWARAPVVLVHGGGKQATDLAHAIGHRPRFVEGRRLTTDLDLRILLWTVCGELNRRLVAQAQSVGLPAVGLSGADGGLLQVRRRPPQQTASGLVDFGYVGDVWGVRPGLLYTLLRAGYLPVVAPLGIDAEGQLYNVNADTVAVEVALALRSQALLWLAASEGVWDEVGRPIQRLSTHRAQEGLKAGWIRDGMRPKIEAALRAATEGLRVWIGPVEALASLEKGTRLESPDSKGPQGPEGVAAPPFRRSEAR